MRSMHMCFVALELGFACFLFLLTNYHTLGHNLVLLKFTIKQLEIILALDRYKHDIEAKCVV